MFEQLNNYLHILTPYFPLGVVGIWRWSVWFVKKTVALRYKPIQKNGYVDTVSIVVPVYNEDRDIFKRALESWKKNSPDEIIAVIDYTDKTCIEEFKKFQQKNKKISKLIITKKPGKREALSDGIRVAKYNIIALVDSDTIWKPDIKEIILAPFKDSSVGGVGPRQDVLDINTLARRLFNIHIDHRYYDEMTYLATVANGLTCISGRTAIYRAIAIKNLCDDLENETFLGTKCISGDDKCLTRLVQQDGWKVRYQGNALVLTPGAPDILTLLKQQMRWTRNTYRSDFKSLASKWIWKREKFLAFHMIDRFTQPFTLILGPIYFTLSIIWGHWLIAGILFVWWHFSRSIKLYPHLKHRPLDILILPIYVATTYILAILKIYAMVTIRQQGWITRWHKSRLHSEKNYFHRLLKFFVPYTATASIILLLGFGVVSYKNIAVNDNQNMDTAKYENMVVPIDVVKTVDPVNTEDINIDERKQAILNKLEEGQFGYYTVRKGDTLHKIANRYNADLGTIIEANSNKILDPNRIKIGQQVIIPIGELRKIFDKNKLVSYRKPEIFFDKPENTINVRGEGSVVTISKIYNAIKDDQVLEKLENKEWLLKANLFIEKDVILLIDGNDVAWLKMKSDEAEFVWLKSYRGGILISNTKITSWDDKIGGPDTNYSDGRSYILAKLAGRMDILNSELAFLGHPLNYKGEPLGHLPSPGGVYGVSWRISTGTFNENLITGSALNSKFHHNYFGVYTFGATGMFFKNNEFYDNVQYGFDPHDDSNNFLIESNMAFSNGNHGMIVSKRCFNNIFRNNISYDNKLHGIMLDRQSNNNLVENNTLYGNVDGIALYDSHDNLIINNKIKENKNGIRANVNSSENYIERNNITKCKNGIFFYDNANSNFVANNIIRDNAKGIYIKNSANNLIKDSLVKNSNRVEIKLDDNAKDNFIQKIQ